MTYPSPGGSSGEMRGCLVQPSGAGPFPAVLVIRENRGLNPYIEDVAGRAAVAGFLALAPDGLAPLGGYPGNDDDGRAMQARLDQAKLRTDMLNSARFVKAHAASSGRLGVTGFCWGGGTTNWLATVLGAEMQAGAPFDGAAPETAAIPAIRAALQLRCAEHDERINAMWPAFERGMKAAGVRHEMHLYPGTQHGFHNNSTPRCEEQAATRAWDRAVAFFRTHLGWRMRPIDLRSGTVTKPGPAMRAAMAAGRLGAVRHARCHRPPAPHAADGGRHDAPGRRAGGGGALRAGEHGGAAGGGSCACQAPGGGAG